MTLMSFLLKSMDKVRKISILFWLIRRQIFWAQKAVITLRWTCSTKVSCRMLFWRIMAGANWCFSKMSGQKQRSLFIVNFTTAQACSYYLWSWIPYPLSAKRTDTVTPAEPQKCAVFLYCHRWDRCKAFLGWYLSTAVSGQDLCSPWWDWYGVCSSKPAG